MASLFYMLYDNFLSILPGLTYLLPQTTGINLKRKVKPYVNINIPI